MSIFTPIDILAACKIAISFDKSFTVLSCSSDNPVVHKTMGMLLVLAYSNSSSMLLGEEKSIITSASTSQSLYDVNTG